MMKHYIKQVNTYMDNQGWSIWWCRGTLVAEYFTRWTGSFDGERWSAKCTRDEAEKLSENFLANITYMQHEKSIRRQKTIGIFTFRRKGVKVC